MKKWREMQKNKFLNSSFSKNRLSHYSKSDNIKTNNTLHDIFKNNKTLLFSFLPIAFFILLDYYTLNHNFNFSSASFTEIYFNSLNLSSQILVLVSVFPFVIIFVFFTIPYLNSCVLGIYNLSVKEPVITTKHKLLILFFITILLVLSCYIFLYNKDYSFIALIFVILLLLVFTLFVSYIALNKSNGSTFLISFFIAIFLFFLSILSYIMLNEFIEDGSYGFIVLILALLLPLILTSFIANAALHMLNIDIKVILKDSPYLSGIYFSISYIILICISYNTLLDVFKFDAIVPFLMFIWMCQYISIIIVIIRTYAPISKTSRKNKVFTLQNISIALLLMMIAIYFVHRENKNLWNNTQEKNTNFSFNLFINKFFLSNNNTIMDINATYYDNNSSSEIKKCWDNKIKNIHLDSNQTTYLPISNEMKLYFKKENENITCVYAINKNQYNYRLQDIGFIDTQKRRDFGKAITKDKK